MTSMPPDVKAEPSQYCHESPAASGHCVLPLLALTSHALPDVWSGPTFQSLA